jgi:hypothetical protein
MGGGWRAACKGAACKGAACKKAACRGVALRTGSLGASGSSVVSEDLENWGQCYDHAPMSPNFWRFSCLATMVAIFSLTAFSEKIIINCVLNISAF